MVLDKNICKHEGRHGCLQSGAAAEQRCRRLFAAFDLLNKAKANAVNKQGDVLQIKAATTRQTEASVSGATFHFCDKRRFLNDGLPWQEPSSSQLSDESSPS